MAAITITMANVDVLILLMPVWRMWPMSRYATASTELVAEVLNIDVDVKALTACIIRCIIVSQPGFACLARSSLTTSLKGAYYQKPLSVKVLQKNLLISLLLQL